jgi:hypothetical protein
LEFIERELGEGLCGRYDIDQTKTIRASSFFFAIGRRLDSTQRRKYRSAAGRGDDHGNDRNGDCALVRVYVRFHWERHADTAQLLEALRLRPSISGS